MDENRKIFFGHASEQFFLLLQFLYTFIFLILCTKHQAQHISTFDAK